jgi:hypothetical protein
MVAGSQQRWSFLVGIFSPAGNSVAFAVRSQRAENKLPTGHWMQFVRINTDTYPARRTRPWLSADSRAFKQDTPAPTNAKDQRFKSVSRLVQRSSNIITLSGTVGLLGLLFPFVVSDANEYSGLHASCPRLVTTTIRFLTV